MLLPEYGARFFTYAEARKRLGVSKPVLLALVQSGLLGHIYEEGKISGQAISSYERFGTQWGLGKRAMSNDIYDSLPPIDSVGPQPPATQTHAFIGRQDGPQSCDLNAAKSDKSWIAHFYLVPNHFYFPHPTELSLVEPPPLKLSMPRVVSDTDLLVTLYPHTSGYLGLVCVEGKGRPIASAQREAYNAAIPVLDELSVRYDVPLPVAQSMIVGLPSGLIHVHFPHRPKAKEIGSGVEILPRCPHPELRDAYALYREAVSSSNPFHAFLTFWKVYEEADYIRKGWGEKYKRSDTKVREEVFPDLFAFGAHPEELAEPPKDSGEIKEMYQQSFRGSKFKKARQKLDAPYRVALAHAGKVDAGKPLTGASFEDYHSVATKLPIVRYMANVVLENVRATFDAQGDLVDREISE